MVSGTPFLKPVKVCSSLSRPVSPRRLVRAGGQGPRLLCQQPCSSQVWSVDQRLGAAREPSRSAAARPEPWQAEREPALNETPGDSRALRKGPLAGASSPLGFLGSETDSASAAEGCGGRAPAEVSCLLD